MNPVDIAKSMEELNDKSLLVVFRLLTKDTSAEVFSYLDKESQQKIIELITDDEVKEIIELVKQNDGVDKAIDLAQKYTDKAFKDIDKLPENEYKEVLRALAEKLILRKY